MTLIATTVKANIPVVISDILISDKVDKGIQVPTNVFDINPYLSNDRKPVNLNQKAYIIKDNLCIAFAGVVSEIEAFLRELKIRCSYFDNVSKKEIEELLNDYNLEQNFSNSGFLMLVMEKEVDGGFKVNNLIYPTNIFDSVQGQLFDGAIACGSGKGDFLHWMKSFSVDKNNDEYPTLQAIAINASYIARLLAIERTSLHTIKSHWGGSFEMMFFSGKSFKKVGDIAYIVFQVYFHNDRIKSVVPGLVLYNRYINDNLFVTAIDISEYLQLSANGIVTYISNEYETKLYPVAPFDSDHEITDEDLSKDLSFKTNKIGVGFAFMSKKAVSPASFYVHDINSLVKYNNKSIKISLRQEGIDIILNKAMAIYATI